MTYMNTSLTITSYASCSHPHFECFLFTYVNGKSSSKLLPIDEANKLMWELKAKGWETKTTASYNRLTPKVYTREISWLHIEG